MAHTVTVPFTAFRLHFNSELSLLSPLKDQEILRTGSTIQELAAKYEKIIQKQILNEGKAMHLLKEWDAETLEKATLEVSFPAAKDGLTFPAFSLEFDFYVQRGDTGYWGLVPTLGVEAFGMEYEALEKRLQETIRIEFARKGYLNSVQNIITSIWYDHTELQQAEMRLHLADPGEDLEKSDIEKNTRLLRKVAKPLRIKKREMYGRDDIFQQLEQIFKSNYGRNLLLVGPPGVGKTALVWEWSRHMQKAGIPGAIWETTASNMIKELTGDTGWEYNIGELCRELKELSDDFLYLRSLIDLFEVGKYMGNNVSMAEYLLPFISRGEINLIAECTDEELARIELESPSYTAHFQMLKLETPKNLEEIILKKVQDVAEDAQVDIAPEAIREVIRLTQRFTPYAGMPGRPIRFLESILLNKHRPGRTAPALKIGRTEVIEHFCNETGMPRFMVDPSIPLDPNQIKKRFNENVFGQEVAVNSLANILATVKVALNKTGKPIGSFLFVGPTGVGKTEMAKVLAEFMFGNRNRMLRFDMSEYSHPYSVMRLIGREKHTEGLLTAAIRREPFSVLLFDEIEKADRTFFDLLLQVLSEGRLTDNRGNLANFCSAIIIMTSNIGAANMQWNQVGMGRKTTEKDIFGHFETAVRKYFRPELYNRIDRIIPFQPLDQDTVRFVLEREFALFKRLEGIKFRKLDLEIAPEVYEHIAKQGFDPKYGARFLQRILREELIMPVARSLNQEDFDDQLQIHIQVRNGRIEVESTANDLTLELLLEELNKIQHADYAASCRRSLEAFMEGYTYTMLLQQLDELEVKKKKLGEKFWGKVSSAARLTQILELKAEVENKLETITGLENDLSLMALGFQSYDQKQIDALEAWDDVLFDLERRLFAFMQPADNKTYLSVYGSGSEPLLDLYWQLLKMGNWESLTGKSFWIRDGASDNGAAYWSHRLPDLSEKKNWFPLRAPSPGLELVGFELEVRGAGVVHYLQGEGGYQSWKFAGRKDPGMFLVRLGDKTESPPPGIHRATFFKKRKSGRSYNGRKLVDRPYDLNREIAFEQIPELLHQILAETYKQRIRAKLRS